MVNVMNKMDVMTDMKTMHEMNDMKSRVKLIEEGTITDQLQTVVENIIARKFEERDSKIAEHVPKPKTETQDHQVHRGKVIERKTNLIIFREQEVSESTDMEKVTTITVKQVRSN